MASSKPESKASNSTPQPATPENATKQGGFDAPKVEAKTDDEFDFDAFGADFNSVGNPNLDGWFKPEVGAGFAGTIVGHFQIPPKRQQDRVRDVILVELAASCRWATDSDGKPLTLAKGDVLAVSMRADLEPLLEYVEHHGQCVVKAIEQVDVGRPQPMWKFNKKVKGKRSTPVVPAQREDVIPF